MKKILVVLALTFAFITAIPAATAMAEMVLAACASPHLLNLPAAEIWQGKLAHARAKATPFYPHKIVPPLSITADRSEKRPLRAAGSFDAADTLNRGVC